MKNGIVTFPVWLQKKFSVDFFSTYQIEAFISLPHLQLMHLDFKCYLLSSFLNLFSSVLAEKLAKCHVHIDLLKKRRKKKIAVEYPALMEFICGVSEHIFVIRSQVLLR